MQGTIQQHCFSHCTSSRFLVHVQYINALAQRSGWIYRVEEQYGAKASLHGTLQNTQNLAHINPCSTRDKFCSEIYIQYPMPCHQTIKLTSVLKHAYHSLLSSD